MTTSISQGKNKSLHTLFGDTALINEFQDYTLMKNGEKIENLRFPLRSDRLANCYPPPHH